MSHAGHSGASSDGGFSSGHVTITTYTIETDHEKVGTLNKVLHRSSPGPYTFVDPQQTK